MSRPARLPLFWRIQIASWVLFALATFPLKLAAFPPFSAAVVITLTREPLGFLLTCGLRLLYRRLFRREERSLQLVLVVIGLSAVAGVVDGLLGRAVSGLLGHREDFLLTLGVSAFRGTLYVTWSLLYFWIKAVRAGRERKLALAHAETSRREAEFQLLRAQINPHFLFNALNTILATLEPGQTRPQRVVEGLADYLRYSLQHRADQLVPLGAEYDATLSYLAVEQERFRDELIADCSIEEPVRPAPVPAVLLQPLIENALKFSRQTSEPPYRVRVRVTGPLPGDRPGQTPAGQQAGTVPPGAIHLEVANTGAWVEPSAAPGPHGTGLANLRQRLALLYPDRHRLETTAADGWVRISVLLSTTENLNPKIENA